MSLILCRQEPVTVPFTIEELGIHIYSSQELCYIIYNHPFLVLENFIDQRLTDFLRRELRMPVLAERIEKWVESRGESDDILFLILQECGYYSQKEINAFRQMVNGIRKLSPEEYKKAMADYFYSQNLFGKAISLYEELLNGDEHTASNDFKARLWNNIAACYGKLFCYRKAMRAYENAWNEKPDAEFVKRMYFLTVLDPSLSMKPRYEEMKTEEDKKKWDQEMEEAKEAAKTAKETVALKQIFEKDPIKRISLAGEQLNRWKSDYRRML